MRGILARVVDTRGRIRACSAEELQAAWKRTAGEALAKHTWVARLTGQTLHVAVDSSVLLQQLVGFRQQELLQAAREQFRRTHVEKIKFALAALRKGRS